MNWDDYRQHLKDEWEFHKRNPELFFMWAVFAASAFYAFTSP